MIGSIRLTQHSMLHDLFTMEINGKMSGRLNTFASNCKLNVLFAVDWILITMPSYKHVSIDILDMNVSLFARIVKKKLMRNCYGNWLGLRKLPKELCVRGSFEKIDIILVYFLFCIVLIGIFVSTRCLATDCNK